ncbi:MAG: GNAT family N-acetyltransferase [Syntrophomonadaceae bacterium]
MSLDKTKVFVSEIRSDKVREIFLDPILKTINTPKIILLERETNMEKSQDICITIPNNLRYIPLIQDSTAAFARILGFDEKSTNEVVLGVEEAVVNVIDHAFAEGEQASFNIVFQETALGMQILIREQGMPFDPEELAKLAQKDGIETGDTRGLGLHLMYRFMDEVSFVNLGKAGKETRLVKYSGIRLPEVMDLPQPDSHKPAYEVPAYQIHPMKPEQAVEVSKCAYMAYGYSYSNEHVYYPERLRQLNEEGKMVSLVASSENSEIIGHVAMIFQGGDPHVPVVDDAFVNPKYRGAGCLNDLGAAVINWARNNGLTGLYTWAVTTHPYSQKVASKWGLSDTAILISGDLPFDFKAIQEGAGQRESETILFTYLNTKHAIPIYPPAHHADMIKQIYDSLGVQASILQADSSLDLLEEEAVLELKYDPSSIAFVTVKTYGKNVVQEVNRMLRGLCLERLETIYLNLPLTIPYTAILTEEFETLGFFFSGIMPGSEGRDQLILQYLNNQVIDYDLIKVHNEMGRIILAYIKNHDPNQMLES